MMKSKNISLVITDMDKTLLDNDSKISGKNLSFIKKLKRNNIKFAVATGRSRSSLCKFLGKYQLIDEVDYIISMNGVSIFDTKSRETYDFGYVDEEIINEVYNAYKDYDVSFAVHEGNCLICNKKTTYTDIECEVNGYGVSEISDFSRAINKKYAKLMIIGEKCIVDDIHSKLAEIDSKKFNFFKSHDYFLEIVKTGVSKGNALVKLCKLKDIDISNVMAIGDNLNDLDMIKNSGFGVAVENAHEELKKYAGFITKSNDENGFAYACDELIHF
ncbi:Cof-type HAD-IIB family hydrolase [Clostridium estertheticum]|uniref:Cof-type HAD-IIB family hydrolase n=1 Tax=Clostridium estertheticum TaxID=238834 RepID=UPI0013EED024|nr:Cof-type HAD-IIB family hydrolase [Clostridium estertheticum]MBZ9607106.1 Cof-type HAD-IIB family hydrolase [Clostridium estertheticum]